MTQINIDQNKNPRLSASIRVLKPSFVTIQMASEGQTRMKISALSASYAVNFLLRQLAIQLVP